MQRRRKGGYEGGVGFTPRDELSPAAAAIIAALAMSLGLAIGAWLTQERKATGPHRAAPVRETAAPQHAR